MKRVIIPFVLALSLIWAVSASAEVQTYTVRPGDRLERVAAEHGLTGEELLAANPRSAFGVACGDPRRVELRDGSTRAICGRPRFYLIAGKTLVIPTSPLVLETENAQMNDEVVALRAEAEKLRRDLEAGKTAIAELEQERDSLRSENVALVASRAELQGQYSESQSDFEMVSSRQPKEVEVQKTNYVHIILAVAITSFFATLVIMIVSYCKGKKFNRLVQLVQPSLLEQAAKNKQRGAELDKLAKELERKKGELDDLQTKLAKQKSEQDQRDGELKARDETLKQGASDLATAKLAVEGREATCTRREGEIQYAEKGLLGRTEAFGKHVKAEEERLARVAEEGREDLAARAGRASDQEKILAGRSRDADEREAGLGRREEALRVAQEELVRRTADFERRVEEAKHLLTIVDELRGPAGKPAEGDDPDATHQLLCGEPSGDHDAEAEPEPEPITCGACGEKFPSRSEFDQHKGPKCPNARPHVPTVVPRHPPMPELPLLELDKEGEASTGPHLPAAEHPIPHSESSFWCVLCKKDVPMDDMERHNGLHKEQDKPGPLS